MKLNNKQKKLAVVLGLVLILVIVLLIVFLGGNKNKKLTQEEEMKEYLETKVKNFYENNYYDQMSQLSGDIKSFLVNFENDGIPMSVNVLLEQRALKQSEVDEKLVNKETKEKCNLDETKVILYPQEPFSKTSYKLETIVSCGFEK